MSELLRSLNPALGDILGQGARQTARPNRQTAPRVNPEEERSLVGSLRDKSLTALGVMGNTLDLPGSMVRDVVASVQQGKFVNPFDQLLTPFSSDNRTTGEDILKNAGATSGQGGFGSTVGGIATEIAFDPLTYMTFGLSAAGKAGKAARGAGLLDNAPAVAAKKFEKPLGEVGARESRVGTTLDDFVKFGSPEDAAKASDLLAANPQFANQSLGGTVGVGIPFMDPAFVFGQGERGRQFARGTDKVLSDIRHARVPGTDFRPIDRVVSSLDATTSGTKTRMMQALARMHHRARDKAPQRATQDTARYFTALEKAGLKGQEYRDMLRQAAEEVIPIEQLPQAMRPIAQEMIYTNRQIPGASRRAGRKQAELLDEEAGYAARYLVREHGFKGGKGARVFESADPSKKNRKDFLRDVPGGTTALVNKLLKDKELNDMISQLFPDGTPRKGAAAADIDMVTDLVKAKSEGWLPDEWRKFVKRDKDGNAVWETKAGRYKKIAKWMSNLSEDTRRAGVFGNDPLLDHHYRQVAFEQAQRTADTVVLGLSQPGVIQASSKAANAGADGSVTVSQLIKDLGMFIGDEKEGAGRRILEGLGQTVGEESLKELKKMRVRKEHADDLRLIYDSFSMPDAISEILDHFDSFTNWWKGAQTSVWPAFHVRNYVSGQVQNMAMGILGRTGHKEAIDLVQGKVIKNAAKKPWVARQYDSEVQRMMAAGADPSQIPALDDKYATEIIGRMVASNEVIGKYEGNAAAVAGRANQPRAATDMDDFLDAVPRPGRSNISPGRVARKFVGMEPGTDWNLMGMRGVRGREASTLGPAAAGEEVAHATEFLLRVGPWMTLMDRGHDASEAALRVGKAQARYAAKHYTPFERTVMQRAFPFYKFSRNAIPEIVKNIIEKPGGVYGQAIRGTNRFQSQGELAPDYVRDSASIPLSGDSPLAGISNMILGAPPEGTDRYLTGFGLMHEDILGFGPSVSGALGEVISRSNPMIKTPIEWAAQESFFQRGPQGGRDLNDMDPTLGRIVANVTGQTGSDASRKFPLWFEQVLANSPVSRGLTTVRKLTDPRKRSETVPFMPGSTAILNVLTGASVADISPGAKDAIVRELLNQEMTEMGATAFERMSFPKSVRDKMTPEQLEAIRPLEGLANTMADRAKRRAKEREADQK